MGTIKLKRLYSPYEIADGYRILVDRLWPRGISKETAHIDLWLKDIAPSNNLRKKFHQHPEQWEEFTKAYAKELDENPSVVSQLSDLCKTKPVTLIYSAKDTDHNNAKALLEYLQQT